MPELLRCPSCKANLEIEDDESRAIIRCAYCGSTLAVPEHLRAKPQQSLPEPLPIDLSSAHVTVVTERSLPASVGILIWFIVILAVGIPLLLVIGNIPAVQEHLGWTDDREERTEATTAALATRIAEQVMEAVATPTSTPASSPTPAFAEPALAVGEKGTGRGQFENPRRLAVDNAGRVYVWDMDGHRVQVFDEAGTYQTQWPLEGTVRFLLADQQDRLYVLGDTLSRYDGMTGDKLDEIAVTTPRGVLTQFQAMALTPQGDLILSYWDRNEWMDVLLRVDSAGALLELWLGAMTTPYGQDGVAKQLAVDRSGFIYAFELEAILKFGSDGRFLNRVGSRGSGPGEWTAPQNIAVDRNGRLYVGEWRGIHVYDGNARFLDTIATNAYVMDLAISDNNDIWAIVGTQLVRFALLR